MEPPNKCTLYGAILFAVFVVNVAGKNSFLLIAPNTIRPGHDFEVEWRILKVPDDDVIIKTEVVTEKGAVVSNSQTTLQPGAVASGTSIHSIPTTIDSKMKHSLKVSVSGGITFKKEHVLSVQQKSISVFIQTDKLYFKPGQTVHFRVFGVTPDLKVVYDKLQVEIQDPKGNIINQWHVSGAEVTSLGGVYEQQQVMSEFPVLGKWKIKAKFLSYSEEFEEQGFNVEEYVLPKFEVELDLPPFGKTSDAEFEGKIKSKYTFGKPVKGDVSLRIKPKRERFVWKKNARVDTRKSIEMKFPINGEAKFTVKMSELKKIETLLSGNSLVFSANVTESLTKITQTDTQEVKFYSQPIVLQFPSALPSTFKPGMTYDAVVKVSQPDGSPLDKVTEQLKVTITEYKMSKSRPRPWPRPMPLRRRPFPPIIEPPWIEPPRETRKVLPVKRLTVPADGVVDFPLNPGKDVTKITIKASYDGVTKTKEIKKRHSPSSSYLQVTSQNSVVQAGQTLNLEIKTTEKPDEVFFLIFSKGRLIDTGIVPLTGTVTSWSVTTSARMAPRARFVVYYVRADGEVVADALTLNIDGVFENKVSINFNKTESTPSDNVRLDIRADSGSKVNVLAVDKSVLLMGTGNDVSKNKVVKELQSFNLKSTKSSSKDFPVCDWFCWRWPISVGGNDVKDVFEDAGVIVLTDALVYEYRRKISGIFRRIPVFFAGAGPRLAPGMGPDRRMVRMRNAMPRPVMKSASIMKLDVADQAMPSKPEELAPVQHVRKLFPETWLWKRTEIPSSGVASSIETVPDTITSWVATAFAVHPTSGLGLTESAASLQVSMQFFVTMNLPYSVIRGEKVIIQVSLHNYGTEPQFTYVELKQSPEFDNIQITSSGQTVTSSTVTRTISVGSNEVVAVYFPIIPKKLGKIDINVKAQSSMMSDAVSRKLLVEAEGSPREYNLPVVVDLKERGTVSKTVTVDFPARTVPGSERIEVTAIGDLMGPSIKGLDTLLKMPYGCGEQNMLKFAPNIFIVRYLETTNNLEDAIFAKAKEYMEKGYQRELTYMHTDGSFSAFGERDPSGSTWLTAFVVKSFAEASDHIFIDEAVVLKAIDWLLKQQNQNGTFNEPGRVIHKSMQGGSTSGQISLTAYIMISMLEARHMKGVAKKIESAKGLALKYLENEADGLTDVYDLAIVHYCFRLANSSKADLVEQKLNELAKIKDGTRYWEKQKTSDDVKPWERRKGVAINIEVTSYALLALAGKGDRTTGVQVLKWVTEQRNPDGGFSSTQDTVLALQALAEMAAMIYSPGYDLVIDVTAPSGLEQFTITDTNALVLQSRRLPVQTGNITVTATGQGLALVQVGTSYNIDDDDQKQSFVLRVSVPRETQYEFDVDVCARWTEQGSSSMAIIEIGSPSGFFPDKETIQSSSDIKRTETELRKLTLYFDEIGSQDTCVKVTMQRITLVAGAQPVPVKVYDYYEPSKQVTEFYVPKALRNSDVCDICGSECDFCGPK